MVLLQRLVPALKAESVVVKSSMPRRRLETELAFCSLMCSCCSCSTCILNELSEKGCWLIMSDSFLPFLPGSRSDNDCRPNHHGGDGSGHMRCAVNTLFNEAEGLSSLVSHLAQYSLFIETPEPVHHWKTSTIDAPRPRLEMHSKQFCCWPFNKVGRVILYESRYLLSSSSCSDWQVGVTG